jgi:hypothetical protein
MAHQLTLGTVLSFAIAIFTPLSSAFGEPPGISFSTPGVSWDAGSPPAIGTVKPDWLTDVNPLLVITSKSTGSTITVDPRGFPPVPTYIGRLNLSISCCGILDAPGQVLPGIAPVFGNRPIHLTRPNTGDFVDVNGSPVQIPFTLTAAALTAPGNFTARIRAQDATQGIDRSRDVLFSILPPWPGDGPIPTCTKSLTVIKLSGITPDPYSIKLTHLSDTSFPIAIRFSDSRGLQLTVHAPPSPLPPNTALVTFKHDKGWHVGIRNENSINCATSGKTLVVEEGQTVGPFSISTANTSTLVFSKPVCRFTLFWCWSVGLEDVAEFSEGPFWALFGGRQVDIITVGDWADVSDAFIGEADLTIQMP